MKLLVVEDETKIGEYLRQGLMEAGFVVSLARNGLDGHHLAMTEPFDLVILDVMLPDIDGWRILKSLREAGKNVPVMFLTARDSVNDRVKGLELGADDYLTNITVDPIFRHNCRQLSFSFLAGSSGDRSNITLKNMMSTNSKS